MLAVLLPRSIKLSFVAYTNYGEQTIVVIVLMKVHNFLNLDTLSFCSNCLNFKILHLYVK